MADHDAAANLEMEALANRVVEQAAMRARFPHKDSGLLAIFVIFICSLWPVLINTAFRVMLVPKEWLNVAPTLEVTPLCKAFRVILPAVAPTIMTGMRISVGTAWLAIAAAKMLVGGTGIGYFVWNEWNNLNTHYYPIRNYLLDFLIGRSKIFDQEIAGRIHDPKNPPLVMPGISEAPTERRPAPALAGA